jgi:hypothetical protein
MLIYLFFKNITFFNKFENNTCCQKISKIFAPLAGPQPKRRNRPEQDRKGLIGWVPAEK